MKNSHVVTLVLAAALTGCAEVNFNNKDFVSSDLKAACQAEFSRAIASGAKIGPPIRGAIIENEYIVASRGGSRRGGVMMSAASMATRVTAMSDVKVLEVSEDSMPRVLVEMSPQQAETLASDPSLIVEPNRVVTVSADVDLVVTDFQASGTSVPPNSAVTFQVKVKNNGSLTSGIIGVGVQLEDEKGVSRCACKTMELGPSAESTVGLDLVIPSGSFRARAIVDVTGAVAESDEGNNSAGPIAMVGSASAVPAKPDLIVSMDVGNAVVNVGASVPIQIRVTNQGGSASPATKVALFRNSQAEPAAGTAADATVDIPALQPQGTSSVVGNLTFTAGGVQQVRAMVDREGAISETNETNNSAGPSPLTVSSQVIPTGIRRMNVDKATVRAGDRTGSLANENIVVAIVDTGIDLQYTSELNVVGNQSFVGGTGQDANGHGTHVSGTVGAYDNNVGVVGVAPGVKLYAVRVLGADGSGSNAGVISGINFACNQASGVKVLNMSLGGGFSQLINDAVKGCTDKGITVVVAAGNENQDAANVSPASEPTAITVGALADYNGMPGGGAPATVNAGPDDTFATFSNFGAGLDVMAPGVAILSTRNGGGTTSLSGTSMASPHIAGLAVLHLLKNPTATPAQVAAGIIQTANTVLKRGNAGRDYPIANAETY